MMNFVEHTSGLKRGLKHVIVLTSDVRSLLLFRLDERFDGQGLLCNVIVRGAANTLKLATEPVLLTSTTHGKPNTA